MSAESLRVTAAAPPVPAEPGPRDSGVFATTHWSLVLKAGSVTNEASLSALDRLCRQYWRPLYYFVRRRGYDEQESQDLTQGFFTQLLEKDLIGVADRGRGRFRTFLLAALQNYLSNEWDRANRQKRGGGQTILSLDQADSAEAGYQLLPHDTASPDQLYERRWVQAILEVVLHRLREEFDGRHGRGRFDVLKEFLFTERGEISYADAARRLNLSESATKSAIYRLRQRYGELFAEEISQTVANPEDVDDEIRHLLTVLESCR